LEFVTYSQLPESPPWPALFGAPDTESSVAVGCEGAAPELVGIDPGVEIPPDIILDSIGLGANNNISLPAIGEEDLVGGRYLWPVGSVSVSGLLAT
jgi:subtilisin family serine protease